MLLRGLQLGLEERVGQIRALRSELQEEAPGAPSEAGASRDLRVLVRLRSVLRLVHFPPLSLETGDGTGPVWTAVASGRLPRRAADRRLCESDGCGQGHVGIEKEGSYFTRCVK